MGVSTHQSELSAAGGRTDPGLLVVPPDPPHLKALASAELACAGRGDATVHQDQLEPLGDALTTRA